MFSYVVSLQSVISSLDKTRGTVLEIDMILQVVVDFSCLLFHFFLRQSIAHILRHHCGYILVQQVQDAP